MRIPLPDDAKKRPRSIVEAIEEHSRTEGGPKVGDVVSASGDFYDGSAKFIGESARVNVRLEILNDAGDIVDVVEKPNLSSVIVVIEEKNEPTTLNGVPGDFCEFNIVALANNEALEKMAVGILDFIDQNGMLASSLVRLQLSRMHAERAGGTPV